MLDSSHSTNVSILNEPEDFVVTLKRKASEAKNQIVLSALYIGNDTLVKELVDVIHGRLAVYPDLKVTFILDYSRSLRSQDDFKSTFQKLNKNHPSNIEVYLYKMPQVSSYLSHNINEILGVYHCKYYIFDDDVILSGANLSTEYFQNRQDRYLLFENNNIANCSTNDDTIKSKVVLTGTPHKTTSEQTPVSLIQWLKEFASITTKFCYRYQIVSSLQPTLPSTPPSFQDPVYEDAKLLSLHLKPLLSSPMNMIHIPSDINDDDITAATTSPPSSTKSNITSPSTAATSAIFTYMAPIVQHAPIGIYHESVILPRFIRNIVSLFSSSSLSFSHPLAVSIETSTNPTKMATTITTKSTNTNQSTDIDSHLSTTNSNQRQPQLEFYVSSPYPSFSNTFMKSFLLPPSYFSSRIVPTYINTTSDNRESIIISTAENTKISSTTDSITKGNIITTTTFTTVSLPSVSLSLFTPSSSAHGFTRSTGIKSIIPHLHQQAFIDSLDSLQIDSIAVTKQPENVPSSEAQKQSSVVKNNSSDAIASLLNIQVDSATSSSSSSNSNIINANPTKVTIHEYIRPNWTYHAKGIWIFCKGSESHFNLDSTNSSYSISNNVGTTNNKNSLIRFSSNFFRNTIRQLLDSPLVYSSSSSTSHTSQFLSSLPFTAASYIGSSNLGARSWKRDFELGFMLFTNDEKVKRQLQAECRQIISHSSCNSNNYSSDVLINNNKNSSPIQSSNKNYVNQTISFSSSIKKSSLHQSSASYKFFIATATNILRSFL